MKIFHRFFFALYFIVFVIYHRIHHAYICIMVFFEYEDDTSRIYLSSTC